MQEFHKLITWRVVGRGLATGQTTTNNTATTTLQR